MLWLALHFPRLPLDNFERGASAPGPFAVASSAGAGATLVACNRSARASGVSSGMTVSAAWALVSDLKIVVRNETAERRALERVAVWAFQFTPAVSLAAPAELLLEVEGSLKLFGGLGSLHQCVAQGLAELGYEACVACSPTPLSAQLFARAGLPMRIQHRDALHHELQKLPIALLAPTPQARVMLDSFGANTIGECLKLPRAGLARRLGPQLLDDLDRALGRLPDPRRPFIAPPAFNASLDLPAPVEHAEALLFGARRLLMELCGWLVATGKGVQRLSWTLAHESSPATRVDMELHAASRDPEHLFELLRDRMAHVELPCPVIAVALRSTGLQPLASRNLSFLPEACRGAENALRLIERLRVRLGEEGVIGVTTLDDHRPERAWRRCKPGEGSTPKSSEFPSRPLWLLSEPRPLKAVDAVPHYEGPLSLLTGPECIESGWWDGHDVARDYFVACNPGQSLLWIYRERNPPAAWYLHGVFA